MSHEQLNRQRTKAYRKRCLIGVTRLLFSRSVGWHSQFRISACNNNTETRQPSTRKWQLPVAQRSLDISLYTSFQRLRDPAIRMGDTIILGHSRPTHSYAKFLRMRRNVPSALVWCSQKRLAGLPNQKCYSVQPNVHIWSKKQLLATSITM